MLIRSRHRDFISLFLLTTNFTQEIFNVVAAVRAGNVLLVLPAVQVSWAAAHVADAIGGVEWALEFVGGRELATNDA